MNSCVIRWSPLTIIINNADLKLTKMMEFFFYILRENVHFFVAFTGLQKDYKTGADEETRSRCKKNNDVLSELVN